MKRLVLNITLAAFFAGVFATVFTSCGDDKPDGNGAEQTGTVKFSIGSISQLKTEIPKITAEAADGKKFIEIELTGNIAVNADDLATLRSFGDIKLDEKKSKINWNGKFIYPAQNGINITHTEWLSWKEPPLGVNPNSGYMFAVSEADRSKFGVYANNLEIAQGTVVDLEKVNFTVANAAELKAKIAGIKAAIDNRDKFAEISFTGNILIADEHREMLKTVGDGIGANKAGAAWTAGRFVAPSVAGMALAYAEWESWGMPPLGKNGNMAFRTPAHEKELFGEYAGVLENDPDAAELETVTFTVNGIAALRTQIDNIEAAVNSGAKFARVDITGNIAIANNDDKALLKKLKDLKAVVAKSGSGLKSSADGQFIGVIWGANGIYPASAGITLTSAEWIAMDSPKITASPTGDKFEVAQNDMANFPGYQDVLTNPSQVGETVDITISNVNEINSKANQAVADAVAGKSVNINMPVGLVLMNNNMTAMEQLKHPNVTFVSGSVKAGEAEVTISAELANKLQLFSGGIRYPNEMFKITGKGGARDYTGDILVKTDTLTHGSGGANMEKLLPATLIFKFHGKDVTDLVKHKGSPYIIQCQVVANNNLPGGKPAMGGVTSEVLAMMRTPRATKPGDNDVVLVFTVHPIVTTYSTKIGFNKDVGLDGAYGIPSNAMVLDTNSGSKAGLGDSIGTNHGWGILHQSNLEVKRAGPYTDQMLAPHVKGNANNEIRVVPIRDQDYRFGGGGGTYLDIRSSNATYGKVAGTTFIGGNGLQLIMNKEDVYVIVSSGQQSSFQSSCGIGTIGGSCWDGKVKEYTELTLNIMLKGNGINAATGTQSGRKIR